MNIALIGYGEVGRILGEDLHAAGHAVTTFDVKLGTEAGVPVRAHALLRGVEVADSHAGAVRSAQLVVSAVTATQTVAAAQACARALPADTFFLDFNSASPAAKIAAAEYVGRAGGRYVEGAVMTSIPPHRMKVPLLLGGPHADALLPQLNKLGFAARVASSQLGVASATKMCRSVMIKGLEAMLIESLTTARRYGVEEAVLASLRETFPGIDWAEQATYFFQRVIKHGRRRAEEMREAAVTVREAGLEPWIAVASAERQDWVADLVDKGAFGRKSRKKTGSADWRIAADLIIDHLAAKKARKDG